MGMQAKTQRQVLKEAQMLQKPLDRSALLRCETDIRTGIAQQSASDSRTACELRLSQALEECGNRPK